MRNTQKSSSVEQQEAEAVIADVVEKWLDCKLEHSAKVVLGEGVHIEPDLYSEDKRIICEIYSHIGALKVGQKHKVSQDILKMILLEKIKGIKYRKIIVVVDDKVKEYLSGKSYIAESVRQFDIEIKKFNLSSEVHKRVLNAQVRQVMINSD